MIRFVQDVRFALRALRRRPWFATAIVLILALGIGSTTAIVSLANATLVRPIDVRDPDRLVEIEMTMSYPAFRDMQQATDIADAVIAYGNLNGVSLNRAGVTMRVPAALVSGNYFEGLGVQPAAGRLLTAADELPGSVPAIVISDRLWAHAFDRSRSIIGETITVNRKPAVIVGVASRGFKGLSLANVGDVWMPAAFTPELATGFIGRPAALTRNMTWMRVVVRLKPGVTLEQASARLTALERHDSTSSRRDPLAVSPLIATSMSRDAHADLRSFMLLLLGVAGALLLLGCSNVANLLLALGASRKQEMAVRAALGAGRSRLVGQLLVESLVLAALGGAAAILISAGLLKAVGMYRLPGDIPIADLGLGIDGGTLATSAVLATLSVLLFGPLPAWLATRRDPRASLNDGSRGSTRLPLGRALVAAQIALCVSLVGGGLLFARGLQRALSFDLGYDPRHVAMTSADPGLERLKPAEVDAYIDAALSRLRADPAVSAAGLSIVRPMRGGVSTSIYVDGYVAADGEDPHISANLVSEGWMEAMGLRLLKGRTLREGDRHATPRAAVISEKAATMYWTGRDPIGARFKFDNGPDGVPYEIVGVVADARYGAVDADAQPFAYVSIFDPGLTSFRSQLHFFVRTAGDPTSLIPRIRDAARAASPAVPLSFPMTMEEHVASVVMPQRLGFVLLVVFASAGLLLSASGVFAIAAYQVSMRTREIGVRMALGAARMRVVKDVVWEGAWPIAIGLTAGIVAQLWASKFAEGFVYGLDVRSPVQIAAASAIVVAAAALALLLPARRAASVDPVIALREI